MTRLPFKLSLSAVLVSVTLGLSGCNDTTTTQPTESAAETKMSSNKLTATDAKAFLATLNSS